MSSSVSRYYFMWTKSDCPYCVTAMQLLAKNQANHTVYTMDKRPDELDKVKEEFNWKTVPVIAVQRSDGLREFIGGCDDLEKYLEEINDRVQTDPDEEVR
jgi:glutaredoxin